MSQKLAGMLYQEDINFESALNLWGSLDAKINLLKNVYKNPKKHYTILSFVEILQENGESIFEPKVIHKIQKEVQTIIELPKHHNMVVGSLGSDTLVVVDPRQKIVYYETVIIKNDNDYSKQKKVIEAYPSEVIVYDSPLAEEPRKFEIKWESKVKKSVLTTGPDLLEDIKNDLIRDGYVTANRLINDILPALMNTYIRQDLAEIKTDIETPGFFHNPSTNEIIGVNYDLTGSVHEELKQGLEILNDLVKYYTGNETKLATIFKWGLISPFIYSKKQQGNWTPWPYLYGKAKSGKTTLGQMVLYMWGEPDQNNDLTGSGFDTVARVGGKISQSTFPIVVNEPAGAFQRVSVTEMLKGAIERTISRGRYEGRRFTNIPSFNPVVLTANTFVPDDDALIRRLLVINFTHNEKKSDKEIEAFETEWQTKNHKKCKFNLLKPISQAAALEYTSDSTLWDLDWKELADILIKRIYADVNMEVPGWLYNWSKSESMEDMDEEHREDIRIFLLDQINRAYGRVQVLDPETGATKLDDYNENLKGVNKFKEKVWTVLNERLIAWMIPIEQKNTKYVCFTIGFKKEIHHELKVCQPLKGLAELMGWKYTKVRLPKDQKVIKIQMDKFMNFLYPSND
ncbi:hypothetical protein [Methanobacterium spitsbergense]|uniref:Uncharacterized protein n=1 Tax=Methanobacterium spitsbergense TaxID=2874285 RepID=A0A8T5UXG5_9EURY|nr:hypothetical protein [Methanobacterium spitsbergense]MBZ2166987.1 hypothetical protein [Methanobacterium spitsbergense]